MKQKNYTLRSEKHLEALIDRLYETYSKVEVINCVKGALMVNVVIAMGY